MVPELYLIVDYPQIGVCFWTAAISVLSGKGECSGVESIIYFPCYSPGIRAFVLRVLFSERCN
jgi:hypothetical protein